VALAFTANHLERDANGYIAAPDAPGLGIEISPAGVRRYLVDVEIKVRDKRLFASSTL
jgi:L-alanine-DL-glutamate epimerase-like enolase superfamily enzyme